MKMFAQTKVTLPAGRHKIIILDEPDSVTEGAQQALRRTMDFLKTTRFALACNTSHKIIEPVQSRCAVIRFGEFSDAQVLAKIIDIFRKENVSNSEDGREALVYTAQEDMRQAIGNLQSTHVGLRHVDAKNVFKVCDEPHPLIIKEMIEHCAEGDIDEAYGRIKLFPRWVTLPRISFPTCSESPKRIKLSRST